MITGKPEGFVKLSDAANELLAKLKRELEKKEEKK